ncbi:transcription antitermination factor NusB [Aeromicrobium halocynthiae]|uniref:Transcription antitermination protein NusB n=1 Tax=Aeromicrobium halocynthiae TaxID=560557 RepID=A0ABN2VRU1_9ACTN
MGARSKYRKRALDVLFESELRDTGLGGTLAGRRETNDPPISEYTVTLVEGVVAEQEAIDALIVENARGWSLQRMPGVDRNLLRIAVYEILHVDDVPDAVAVSEAVALAKELSTDDSGSFVNGVLGRILQLRTSSS